MKQDYVINFKVAGLPCRLIIDDKGLFEYFKNNYWINKNISRIKTEIRIKGNALKYEIAAKPIKLKLLIDMEKKDFSPKDVDWIIRTIIQYNLLKNKILFIHSSAYVHGNKAFVFLGKSGQGKSTTINNFPKSKIIGDDILVLKKRGRHFYAYQSPFEKDRITYYKRLNNVIVKKLFILVKGNELKEKSILSQKAIELLLTDNYMPRMPKVIMTDYNTLVANLIKKIRINKLIFPKKFKYKEFIAKYG